MLVDSPWALSVTATSSLVAHLLAPPAELNHGHPRHTPIRACIFFARYFMDKNVVETVDWGLRFRFLPFPHAAHNPIDSIKGNGRKQKTHW